MAEALIITPAQADGIFISSEAIKPSVEHRPAFTTETDVQVAFGHTTLGITDVRLKDGETFKKIVGNTAPNKCSWNCTTTECGLGQLALSNEARKALDCAATNTIEVFDGRPGFVLTPTERENPVKVVFLSDGDEGFDELKVLDENGNDTLLFRKVKQASSFVISEHNPIVRDAKDGVFLEMNGADSSYGIATLDVMGTQYAVAFCSSRPNLGTRGPEFQILRKAIEGILDRVELQGEERQSTIQNLLVQIDIGYSASLENFAHEVRVPAAGTPYAQKLIDKHGLSDASEITPTMVMNDQYPNSLQNGEVYPRAEAEMGIDAPYRDGGCPGDGERCHIHYPKITRRTLVEQLLEIGMQPQNILYNKDEALDPADRNNYVASNRLAQLNGVPVAKTLRTAQGSAVKFAA